MFKGRPIALFALTLAVAAAGASVAAQSKNTLPATVGDLNTAQLIEVRDKSGQVLLNGTLTTSENTPKETEREADLSSPKGQPAKGKVEIEITRKNGVVTNNAFEIEIEKLPAMVDCEVFLDGRSIGTFVTSKKGKAELELSRKH